MVHISELIHVLEEVKKKYGDVPVYLCTNGTIYGNIEINSPHYNRSIVFIEGYKDFYDD